MKYFTAVDSSYFLGVLFVILHFTTNPSLASEHCPKLADPANGEIDGTCKYAKGGEKCTFTCDKGYVLVGNATITCSDTFSWNGVMPHCTKDVREYCRTLIAPESGEIDGTWKHAKRGDRCKFYCNEGYILVGKDTLTCSDNLSWNDVVPRCIKAKQHCPQLTEPANGFMDGSCKQAKRADRCKFDCNEGYILDGKETLTCSDTLSWNHEVPCCIKEAKQHCPKLKEPANGFMDGTCKHAKSDDRCKFDCNDGYILDGKEILTCLDTLSWNHEAPCCIKEAKQHCPKLTDPANGFMDGSCKHAKSGDRCKFDCNDGYILDRKETLTCLDNLSWNHEVPCCIKEAKQHCPKLTEPANGYMDGTCKHAKSGDRCKFDCNEGYILDGKETLACLDNLSWNHEAPCCIKEAKQHCPKLTEPSNGFMNGPCKLAKSGDRCKFECNERYILDGKEILTCLDTLSWNHQVPCCIKEDVPRGYDCADIKKRDANAMSKMYEIWPKGMNKSILVQCDMTTDNGGWTIIQRRGDFDEKEFFFRDWKDYVNGFGERGKYNEYWIGLDAIHALTNYETQSLRVHVEDFDGVKVHPKFSNFRVGSGSDYKLDVSNDGGEFGSSLSHHNGNRFSTKDKGHTDHANHFKGGWWFRSESYFQESNLNGPYLRRTPDTKAKGIFWYAFRGSYNALKSSEMKVRPRSY